MRGAQYVVRRVADHGLIQVPDLHGYEMALVGERTEVSRVAIATNPKVGAAGYLGPMLRASRRIVSWSRA